jgi:DNA polymerase-4
VRQILHVDMDAFFASVEQRDDPTLQGKPVVVGGASRRGVVAAASYEVRKFGVHSAMPMVEALRRCPHAVVVTPKHGRYSEVSEEVFAIFKRYTPLVEGLSLDEAFLDVTGSQSLFGDGATIAKRIKGEIASELRLTASAGVASCKFAAKIASDLDKPDGLVVVPEDVAGFLAPLPIEKMWGVGPVAAKRLHEEGYRTIGDLAASHPDSLARVLGIWGREICQLARGQDSRTVIPDHLAKSVGAEETFETDLRARHEFDRPLLHQAERVSHRLLREGLSGRTVVLKIKFSDFQLISRRMGFVEPVCDTRTLHQAAMTLLERIDLHGRSVRLTGVAVTDLCTQPPLLLLPEPELGKRKKLEELMLKVQDRFGETGLQRAALANKGPRE